MTWSPRGDWRSSPAASARIREVDGGLEVEIRRRGGSAETRRFAFAINCTGPLGAIERTADPMLRGLLDDGLVRPDPLGIGLEVDQHSRAPATGCGRWGR